MTLAAEYLAVFDKLKAIATGYLKDGQPVFKGVIQGWKSPPTKFPLCFILPDPNLIKVASVRQDSHKFRFIIAVVVEKADVEQGLRDSILYASDLYDLIIADRRLGETVDNVNVTNMEFHWRKAAGFIRHWTALFIEASRFYVGGE